MDHRTSHDDDDDEDDNDDDDDGVDDEVASFPYTRTCSSEYSTDSESDAGLRCMIWPDV